MNPINNTQKIEEIIDEKLNEKSIVNNVFNFIKKT